MSFKPGQRVVRIFRVKSADGEPAERQATIHTVERLRNNRVEVVGDETDFDVKTGSELASGRSSWGSSYIVPIVDDDKTCAGPTPEPVKRERRTTKT